MTRAVPSSPADIEAQIGHTRHRIGTAFDALAARLAPQRLQRDRERPADAVTQLPLLLGLVGLGAGVALAALLPSFPGEARLIARTREALWQGAEALGHQAAARLRKERNR